MFSKEYEVHFMIRIGCLKQLRNFKCSIFKLEELLEQPEYRNFTWIGSGLQRHYGHITIARQDVNYSVPRHRSSLLFVFQLLSFRN